MRPRPKRDSSHVITRALKITRSTPRPYVGCSLRCNVVASVDVVWSGRAMAAGLGLKAAVASIFGVGTGHAALGQWQRGAIWTTAVLGAYALATVTAWGMLA